MYFNLFEIFDQYCCIYAVFVRQGKDKKAEIVLLDHGLYDRLKPSHRQHLCNLYKAIIMRNEDEMEKYSHLLGVKGPVLTYFSFFSRKKELCI